MTGICQCSRARAKLEATTADIRRIVAEQPNGSIGGDADAGLENLLLADQHAAGQDVGLGAFALGASPRSTSEDRFVFWPGPSGSPVRGYRAQWLAGWGTRQRN